MNPPPRFVRFRDLTDSDINVEFHAHTTRVDGAASVAEMIQQGHQCGLSALALTEHVRRESSWFSQWAAEVRSAARSFPDLTVYVGCEAKASDAAGALDASEAILAESDLVVGVVHRFPDGRGGLLEFSELSEEEFLRTEFALAQGLLEKAPIHVLGHPGGMYQRRFKRPFPAGLLRELMARSLERRIAIEINTSYLVDVTAFLDLCQEINPLVSIGSDVHRLDEMAVSRETLRARRKHNP